MTKAKIVAKLAGTWVFSANTSDHYGGTITICERSRRITLSRSLNEPRWRRKRHMVPWVRTLLRDYHIPCQHQHPIQGIHRHALHPSTLHTHLDTISASSLFTTSSICITVSFPLPSTQIHTTRGSFPHRTRLTSRPKAKCTSMTSLREKTPPRRASARIILRQSQPE